jgi:hypothetical protein
LTRSAIRARSNRNRAQDVHLQLAGWRRGVDPFVERHEHDAERLQFLERFSTRSPRRFSVEPSQHLHDL